MYKKIYFCLLFRHASSRILSRTLQNYKKETERKYLIIISGIKSGVTNVANVTSVSVCLEISRNKCWFVGSAGNVANIFL